ncbi:MAG TPA: DNA gyrase inhibitor YacG [Desulfuromonadales bacterium]|nr:DNA gyrase inhibitor YacG [Desulfuromonadales bacterium]
MSVNDSADCKEKNRGIRCPRCRQRVAWEGNPFRPFCSEKCRQIDLGRWAAEEYRVAGHPAPAGQDGEIIPFPQK